VKFDGQAYTYRVSALRSKQGHLVQADRPHAKIDGDKCA